MTRQQRRAAERAARKADRRPGGLMLMRVLHEAHCKAPLLDCTCTPDIVLHESPSADLWTDSGRAHAERIATLKAGLS